MPLLAIALLACGSPGPRPSVHAPTTDSAAVAARIERWRAWEAKPAPTHHIELPDGLGAADVESAKSPRIECGKDADGDTNCDLELSQGLDDDGDPHVFNCRVLWYGRPVPFGVALDTVLASSTLEETPVMTVQAGPSGGVTASVVANTTMEHDGSALRGTAKYAMHYAPGITTSCWDTSPGARKTFARMTEKLFASLVVKRASVDSVLYETASKVRRGDTTIGFYYAFVTKSEEGELKESHLHYHLTADEKAWHSADADRNVERDASGAVGVYRTGYMVGNRTTHLSAKPAESGRMRVKLEDGGRSDAREITPQAPLSTELWEARALARVASGSLPSHRYAFLATNDDGEPTFAYSKLTRLQGRVVLEEIEHPDTKKGAERERNELTVDEHGLVTKQVSAQSVIERMFVKGSLPGIDPKSGNAHEKNAPIRKAPKPKASTAR